MKLLPLTLASLVVCCFTFSVASIGLSSNITTPIIMPYLSDEGCPTNWTLMTNSSTCYLFIADEISINATADGCAAANASATPASAHDEDTNEFIFQLAMAGAKYTWVSLYRDGDWAWLDGTDLDYTKWAEDPKDGDDCAVYAYADSNHWWPVDCSGPRSYVCQMPADPVAESQMAAEPVAEEEDLDNILGL